LFYDVRHSITVSDAPAKGKWRIDIHVYVLHGPDRRLPLVSVFQWLHRWKYGLAVSSDSLTIWDRLRLFGLRPRVDRESELGELEKNARPSTSK
jgi:hypothetical protein